MKAGTGKTALRQRGFTLIELVVTLMVLGILSVTVLPRFFDRRDFDARAFLDQTAGALRYAQKAAVAQRRTVCAGFTGNSVTLRVRSAVGTGVCDTDLVGPASGAPYTVTAPGATTFSGGTAPAGLTFDATGRPGDASGTLNTADRTLTIEGAAATLTVTAGTGYVVY